MHEMNIVHRDLKLENILIAPEERINDSQINIKLTDFGFAILFDPNKGLNQCLGTPMYMAPEILK